MRRRRNLPLGPPEPMPPHLVGVGVVEDWIGPRELPPVSGRPAEPRPGESDLAATYRVEAERRLDAARESWQRDRRAHRVESVVDVVDTRPEVDEQRSPVALEIIEQRRWAINGARCKWRDLAAFERKAARR